MILDTIKKTIKEYSLISKGDRVLVGLSGGADSVCLTHALYSIKDEIGISLYTAHVNHGIRGSEAARDEEFAKAFSASLGIECFTLNTDIPSYASANKLSEELAGRQIRYEFFKKLQKEHGINKISTAHNKNDNAETLIMNFMRGSSINGLCGIPYKRDDIIRPLLDVSREDIERYCGENGLAYVTDSTNFTDGYTRNKIRHILIPLIQREFNSNFINTVTENAVMIKEDTAYIEKYADMAYKDIVNNGSVKINELLKLDMPLQRRVIRHMLKYAYTSLNDISAGYVNDILTLIGKNSGKSINLADNVCARIEYGKLIISKKADDIKPFEYEFCINSTGEIHEISKKVSISFTDTRKQDGAVYLSCGESSRIVIRSRKSGDKFCPDGMEGSKKIKDYFINEKIPKEKRNSVPIIEINGEIAAVGNRVDRRFLFENKGIRVEFKALQEVTI